jgi:vancomycin resistance protein YoaR
MSEKPSAPEAQESVLQTEKIAIVKTVLIWLGIVLGTLAVLAGVLALSTYAYMRMYEGKIYPGVKVLNIRLDGLTPDEARLVLDKAIDGSLEKGLSFSLNGEDAIVPASGGNDLPDVVLFDIDQAVTDAHGVGRNHNLTKVVSQILLMRIKPYHIPVNINIDERRIEEALKRHYQDELPDPVDAAFEITVYKDEQPDVLVIPDKDGAALNMDGVFEKLRQQAEILAFQKITLRVNSVKASKQAVELSGIATSVQEMLERPRLIFTHDGEKYQIEPEMLAGWIIADESGQNAIISQESFAADIKNLAKDVEVQSKNGKMEVQDGKIISFEAGTMGRVINTEKTLEQVLASWPPSSTFPLIVEEMHGQIAGDNLEELGIKELIGIGKSSFAGSPPNRTFNIKKAVNDHVNGTLIAPGEEFSMLKNLGKIDGAHGWLSELVIKGNKTIPEYGGGLCQIGTTMFRGAVDTGLQITERRNHSYRVSYYEPAGTDATIYEPAPDFKYRNDTEKHIYINAYIVGTQIFFEFWGTDDGRQVEVGKPQIYNIKQPPPTKLIETTDLAPGKKKCTESAHAGADAHFSTTITYADGRVREETFRSHYRPWQAVCLIGVEKLSEEE